MSAAEAIPVPQGDEMPAGMLLPAREKTLIMAGVMLSLFLAALDLTIMGVALPRAIADLGGLDLFAWPITSYMLASTAIAPVVGKLSDMFGRKPLLIIGIGIFLVGSVLSGLSGDMYQLIGFRGVQGVGAGVIMANSFTAIGDLFAPNQRGRWTGLLSGVFALASVIGPLLGGALTDHLSWRWIFYINLPLGAIALAVVVFWMPWFRRPHAGGPFDYRGGLLLIVFSGALLLGLSWGGNQYGWDRPEVIAPLALAGLLAALFVVVERRAVNGVLPLALFRNRVFTVSALVVIVVGMGLFAVVQFMPLFVQGAQGASATKSGTVTMPMMGGVVVGSVVTGQILSRMGQYRRMALMGGAGMVVGTWLLSTLAADSSPWQTRGYMVVFGLGIGVALPLYNLAVQNSLPYRQLGVGTASMQFFRQIGGTVGVATFGALLASRFPTQLSKAVGAGYETLKSEPQILLSPEALDQFRAEVEATAPGTAEGVIEVARSALGVTVTDLYLIAAVIMGVGLVVAMFLPVIHSRLEAVRESAAGESGPAAVSESAGGS